MMSVRKWPTSNRSTAVNPCKIRRYGVQRAKVWGTALYISATEACSCGVKASIVSAARRIKVEISGVPSSELRQFRNLPEAFSSGAYASL